jgi:cobalamin biosynthesis Co2+ chelatase CbiK
MSLDDRIFDYDPNDEVHLFPLFTVGGYHLREDLFDSEDSIKNKLTDQGVHVITYEKGLLGYDEIRDVYLNQVK